MHTYYKEKDSSRKDDLNTLLHTLPSPSLSLLISLSHHYLSIFGLPSLS